MAAPVATDTDRERLRLLGLARDFSRYLLIRNPFIKMLGVSGSLSNPDSHQHDDIDFFIIAEKDRVWDCFTLCLLTGWRYCRLINKPRTFLCFNYLIDETQAIAEIENNAATAREYLNLIILQGQNTFRRILTQKKEIKKFYPLEYNRRLQDQNDERRYRQKSSSRLLLCLKPGVIVASKWREWQRKKIHNHGPGARPNKIYSTKKVIRSNFY